MNYDTSHRSSGAQTAPPRGVRTSRSENASRVCSFWGGNRGKKPEYSASNIDEVKKAFEEHKKAAEKHGLKVVFWGSPWGVSESVVVVYDLGESIASYENFMASGERANPFTDGRTNLVYKW